MPVLHAAGHAAFEGAMHLAAACNTMQGRLVGTQAGRKPLAALGAMCKPRALLFSVMQRGAQPLSRQATSQALRQAGTACIACPA